MELCHFRQLQRTAGPVLPAHCRFCTKQAPVSQRRASSRTEPVDRNVVCVYRGLWLVNLITSCYLIRGDVIRNNKAKPSYQLDRRSPVSSGLINTDTSVDDQLDWSLSLNLHYHDIDLFISNRFDFGTLEMNSLKRQ